MLGTPAAFGCTVDKTFTRPPHIEALDKALFEAVQTGGRVIVTMPPRHGKSTLGSKYLAAWFLGWYPDRNVLLCGHGQKFATKFGRSVRRLIREYGYLFPLAPVQLSDESKAADEWELSEGGGLKAAGVGSGITGLPAHLLIIDDPIKGRDEARSETIREAVWEWYLTEAYTRLEPGAAVVLINTRWHEDDLAGRLLRDDKGRWKEIRFAAAAEEHDPLGRAAGDPLWPERYDAAALEEIRDTMGAYWWSALYQQRPTPQEGGMFLRKWFCRAGSSEFNTFPAAAVPRDARFACWWDKAATQGGGDHTVGVLMAKKDDDLWIVDVTRGQWSAGVRDDLIDQVADHYAAQWGRVQHWFEQEPGSGGKQSADISARRLTALGHSVRYEPSSGSKEDRADPLASDLENRWKRGEPVKMVGGPWVKEFVDELCMFPNGTNDDQVDAASGAYNKLARRGIRLMVGAA